MRLKNDPNSALGIREAARLGYNICQGINKANANPHTARADREVRRITRKLAMYRS
jgi:hypothetical protein